MFLAVLGSEKQSQTKPFLVSPQIFWGSKNLFEKTKPILVKNKEKGKNERKSGGFFRKTG